MDDRPQIWSTHRYWEFIPRKPKMDDFDCRTITKEQYINIIKCMAANLDTPKQLKKIIQEQTGLSSKIVSFVLGCEINFVLEKLAKK